MTSSNVDSGVSPDANAVPPRDNDGREGFTLVLAILVLTLLTTLALSLLFVTESEVAISRNYHGSIQGAYAAEAMLKTAREALAFDLSHDKAQWANRWLTIPTPTTAPALDAETTAGGKRYQPAATAAACPGVYYDPHGDFTGKAETWFLDLLDNGADKNPTTPTIATAVDYFGNTVCSNGPDSMIFPCSKPYFLRSELQCALSWAFVDLASNDPSFNTNNVAGEGPNDPVDPATSKNHRGLKTATVRLGFAAVRDAANFNRWSDDDMRLVVHSETTRKTKSYLTPGKPQPSVRELSVTLHGRVQSIWENAISANSGRITQDDQVISSTKTILRGSAVTLGDFIAGNGKNYMFKFTTAGTGIANNYDGFPDGSGGVRGIDGVLRDHLANATLFTDQNALYTNPGAAGAIQTLSSTIQSKNAMLRIAHNQAYIGQLADQSVTPDDVPVVAKGKLDGIYVKNCDAPTNDATCVEYAGGATRAANTGTEDEGPALLDYLDISAVGITYTGNVTTQGFDKYSQALHGTDGATTSGYPGYWALDLTNVTGAPNAKHPIEASPTSFGMKLLNDRTVDVFTDNGVPPVCHTGPFATVYCSDAQKGCWTKGGGYAPDGICPYPAGQPTLDCFGDTYTGGAGTSYNACRTGAKWSGGAIDSTSVKGYIENNYKARFDTVDSTAGTAPPWIKQPAGNNREGRRVIAGTNPVQWRNEALRFDNTSSMRGNGDESYAMGIMNDILNGARSRLYWKNIRRTERASNLSLGSVPNEYLIDDGPVLDVVVILPGDRNLMPFAPGCVGPTSHRGRYVWVRFFSQSATTKTAKAVLMHNDMLFPPQTFCANLADSAAGADADCAAADLFTLPSICGAAIGAACDRSTAAGDTTALPDHYWKQDLDIVESIGALNQKPNPDFPTGAFLITLRVPISNVDASRARFKCTGTTYTDDLDMKYTCDTNQKGYYTHALFYAPKFVPIRTDEVSVASQCVCSSNGGQETAGAPYRRYWYAEESSYCGAPCGNRNILSAPFNEDGDGNHGTPDIAKLNLDDGIEYDDAGIPTTKHTNSKVNPVRLLINLVNKTTLGNETENWPVPARKYTDGTYECPDCVQDLHLNPVLDAHNDSDVALAPLPSNRRPFGGFDQYWQDPYVRGTATESDDDELRKDKYQFKVLTERARNLAGASTCRKDLNNANTPTIPWGDTRQFEWDGAAGTTDECATYAPGADTFLSQAGRAYTAASFVKAAGLVFTRCNGIAFGSDINGTTVIAKRMDDKHPSTIDGVATLSSWNDPIIYDGRMSFYSATAGGALDVSSCGAAIDVDVITGPPKQVRYGGVTGQLGGEVQRWRWNIHYHNHLLPQGLFGCGDIMMNYAWVGSFIQNGIRQPATPTDLSRRQLMLVMSSATLGLGKRDTIDPDAGNANDSSLKNFQLAGSYLGDGLDMRTTSEPLQIIAAPAAAQNGCLSPHIPTFDATAWADPADLVDYENR